MDIIVNEATKQRTWFDCINLKETSMKILKFLNEIDEPVQAVDIAEQLGLKVRAVDAAITKSLVHYGLAKREAKLTDCKKKEYNIIYITPLGRKFLTIKG